MLVQSRNTMPRESNSEIGEEFVEDTRNLLSNCGINSKLTKASGSIHGDCDIVILDEWKTPEGETNKREIAADCKYSGNPPKDKDLAKAVKQAIQSGRDFGIIVRNSADPVIGQKVEMRLTDLIELLS